MSLYFTPNFVMLPTSKPIGGAQVGVLIGVFFVGYVLQITLTAYACRAIQVLSSKAKPSVGIVSGGNRSDVSANIVQLAVMRTLEEEHHTIPIRMDTTPGEQNQDCSDVGVLREPQLVEDEESSLANRKPVLAPKDTRKWTSLLSESLDFLPYIVLFLMGLPVAYATSYTMPFFLSLNVLIFRAINALPSKFKRVANPVLVTGLTMILCVYLFTLMTHLTLQDGLRLYRTGTPYKLYLRGTPNLPLPGAGDLLAALLDVGIVSLALPMFQHRRALRLHFFAIAMPVTALAVPSLFGYPALCHALGVEPAISLAVAPRSVTLALALLATKNLGGSTDVISVLAVVSGIGGPIFGMPILRALRISKGMSPCGRLAALLYTQVVRDDVVRVD